MIREKKKRQRKADSLSSENSNNLGSKDEE